MSAVPSPCINVCRMDEASGWCLGCARTLDEIAQWSTMSEEGKRQVWSLLPGRHDELMIQGHRRLGEARVRP